MAPPPASRARSVARACFAAGLLWSCASPALAQSSAADLPEIVIYGDRGLVKSPAERVLSGDDIAAYGLGSIGDLVDEIARERGESGDQPLYLVNGKRVSGLGDIDAYPTEAIERLQILPLGSAVKLGGSANRRVFNLVLKPQLRSYTARAGWNVATGGSWNARTGELGITDIRRPRRINLTLRTREEAALSESDRDILQPAGAAADLGRFRTLRPALDNSELRLSAADQLSSWIDASFTGRLSGGRSRSALGLGAGATPLEQRSRTRRAEAELQLNGDLGNWLVALTGSYSQDRRRTLTNVEGSDLSGTDLNRSTARVRNFGAELSATGSLFDLPAGPLNASLRGALSRDTVSGSGQGFAQSTAELTAGIQLPIASAGAGVLPALGELSAGIEVSRSRVSRFGTLASATYSLQWQPADWLRVSGSATTGRTPPGVALTASPLLATPGTRYIDPLTGETVDVTEISGGNPELGAQRGASRRLSVQLKPLRRLPLTLTADYSRTSNRDFIAALPFGSELLLGAFPDRFVRDASGRLVQVDVRPVTFLRQAEEQLRSTAEITLPLGGDSGRLQLNIGHNWLLRSKLRIADGVEDVDLLSPDALAIGGGGRARHELDFTVGYSQQGAGLRLTGNRRGVSFLNLTTGANANVLRFSPLTTLDLRAWVDGPRLLPAFD